MPPGARKLKCSGKHSGCSRCVHLGLVCKFHDKGIPGRPRKWSLADPREPHRQQTQQRQEALTATTHETPRLTDAFGATPPELQPQSHPTPSLFFAEASSVATSGSTDMLSSGVEPQEWTRERHEVVFSDDELSALPFLDFNTSGQLDSLPLDSFRACLSPEASPAPPAAPPEPCDCSKRVFDMIRSLNCEPVSHSTVHTLRLGTDLFEKLLTCPKCYDVSKPPRITLQNVLLIGRLTLEVTTGYQKYLKWLKDYCTSLAERSMSDTMYLIPGADVSSALGFRVSSEKFFDLVTHGLNSDAERLSALGAQFATRQRNRHLIGHQACPDSEGRCWKEKEEVDPDPSDVCPQSPAARALIPCYRVVDEVRAKIKQLEEAVA